MDFINGELITVKNYSKEAEKKDMNLNNPKVQDRLSDFIRNRDSCL